MNPDPIKSTFADYIRSISVPDTRPDATAVATQRFPTAHNTVGPASSVHAAQPVGGLLGTLLNAGNQVDNFVRSRIQTYGTDRAKHDAGLVAMLAAPELLGAARLPAVAGEAIAAAAPAAEAGMMTAEQLQQWRKIEQTLNALNQSRREAREFRGASALPPSRVPLLPDRPGVAGMEIPTGMRANMLETGFANLPMTPESVVLPASGAGRAGSTATAVARAKEIVGPETLKRMAQEELARRGGTSTEASMASMEQVARHLASQR